MKRARILISGFVQGVGYRHFVKKEALKLGLKGWVRNLPAGRQGLPKPGVEAVFQGEESLIKKAIEACRKGPFLSEVKDVKVEWEEGKGEFESFEIVM